MTVTLICTVGGSHEPIINAICNLQPDHVCFVCSGDDPATGRPGSYTQITGRGRVIKAAYGDEKATLPNIPSQTGLEEGQFEVLPVSPDDFDDIYRKVMTWLAGRDRASEQVFADYTGGTKTMSAALVAAVLDDEGVELQLVTGRRDNLIKVKSGSELMVSASVEATRFHRRLRVAVSAWSRFAYDEAVAMLEAIRPPRDGDLRGEYQRALDLSRAFAAWDRFDHTRASQILENYRSLLGADLGPLYLDLDVLKRDGPGREPMQIFDLWRNAGRRAAQGRYDDAVARLYRLLEWSAQWLLRERAGIDTADVAEDNIPPGMELFPNRDGHFQAGLFKAWELVAHHCGDELAAFWNQEKDAMLDHLQSRNSSILAHGFKPLDQQAWSRFGSWMENRLLPRLLAITDDRSCYRIGRLPIQLPARYVDPSL